MCSTSMPSDSAALPRIIGYVYTGTFDFHNINRSIYTTDTIPRKVRYRMTILLRTRFKVVDQLSMHWLLQHCRQDIHLQRIKSSNVLLERAGNVSFSYTEFSVRNYQ